MINICVLFNNLKEEYFNYQQVFLGKMEGKWARKNEELTDELENAAK